MSNEIIAARDLMFNVMIVSKHAAPLSLLALSGTGNYFFDGTEARLGGAWTPCHAQTLAVAGSISTSRTLQV